MWKSKSDREVIYGKYRHFVQISFISSTTWPGFDVIYVHCKQTTAEQSSFRLQKTIFCLVLSRLTGNSWFETFRLCCETFPNFCEAFPTCCEVFPTCFPPETLPFVVHSPETSSEHNLPGTIVSWRDIFYKW